MSVYLKSWTDGDLAEEVRKLPDHAGWKADDAAREATGEAARRLDNHATIADEITLWAVAEIGNGGAVNLSRAPKAVKDAAARLLDAGKLQGELKRCWT